MRYILNLIEDSLYGLCKIVDGPNYDSVTFIWFDGTKYTVNVKQLVTDE